MPIVAVGSIMICAFAAMLAFCLGTGTPCPVDGFDEAVSEGPQVASRYFITSTVAAVLLVFIFVFSVLYIRKKWNRPGIAVVATAMCAFLMAMIWGIADSGTPPDRQLLIFASIQFLVAGLVVFNPFVSVAYFVLTFFAFSSALDLSGQMSDGTPHDLAYLAALDVFVNWVIYGLFYRATQRQRDIADMSRRDELTGAKNRHYLRDDFAHYLDINTYVMLCDIDNFKRYNDEYDHDVGDYLLKQFYYALQEAFGDECTYRYGGDEFLVVVPEFGKEGFERKIDTVKKQLALVEIDGEDAVLTFSGGYVEGVAKNNEDFRVMLHDADECLLHAKRTGKNRVVGS